MSDKQAHFYRIVSLWSISAQEREEGYRQFIELFEHFESEPGFFRAVGHARDNGYEYALCARDRAPLTTAAIINAADNLLASTCQCRLFLHLWHRRDCVAAKPMELTIWDGVPKIDDNLYQVGTYERSEDLSSAPWSEPGLATRRQGGATKPPTPVSSPSPSPNTIQESPKPATGAWRWTGKSEGAYYYSIITLWAPTSYKLEQAYKAFWDYHLNPNINIEKVRVFTGPVKDGEGFEAVFTVLDLHLQTVDMIKDATLAYLPTLPIATSERDVEVYSHWRNPMKDEKDTRRRLTTFWPTPSHPHDLLGAVHSANPWQGDAGRTQDVEKGSGQKVLTEYYDAKSPSENFDAMTKGMAKEKPTQRPQYWTNDLEPAPIQKSTPILGSLEHFQRRLADVMGWKHWTRELEIEDPSMVHRCCCRIHLANYMAQPCGHSYLCIDCSGDYNNDPFLKFTCPKCYAPMEESEWVDFPAPREMPPVPKSVMSLDVCDPDENMDDDMMELEDWYGEDEDNEGALDDWLDYDENDWIQDEDDDDAGANRDEEDEKGGGGEKD